MRQLKSECWATHPGYLLGYNYAFAPENYPVLTHEMREAMAGGGMWLQEAIKEYGYGDSLRYTQWTQSAPAHLAYAPHELAVAKQIQAMGGAYHCCWALNNSPASSYKLIYGLIAGGHSVYGTHEVASGCDNWGKFMTRWSTFLWHSRLRPVAHPAERVSVETPGLYWQPLLQEFVDTPTRKFTVLHLVNPSPDDRIDHTTLPTPVDGAVGHLSPSPGAEIRQVVVVRPESEPYEQALPLAKQDGRVSVTLPRVNVWAMVIIEEAGTFTVPPDPPRFTEAPEAAEVAAGRQQASAFPTNDPLQPPPVGLTLTPNDALYETDTGYNSVPAQAAMDPLACNGRAQVRESHVKSVYFGRTWLGAFPPGRYRIRLRLRLEDAQQPPRRQRAGVTIYTLGAKTTTVNVALDSDPTNVPPERRLIIDGQYHDYDLREIELHETAMLHVIGNTGSEDADGNRFFCDHIVVIQLERFQDSALTAWYPDNKPAGLRAPQGKAPERVLQVRGLYWPLYRVEQVIPHCTGSYKLPDKYEELYAYDAVVLTNMDAQGFSFPTRRMLCDFVKDGGRLVILGGLNTLGQGGMTGTNLEELLPFTLKGWNEVIPQQPPLLLGAQPGAPWPEHPALFWRHELAQKPAATSLAYAGSFPIAARLAAGGGQVVVFAGAALGGDAAGTTPFWKTEAWIGLLRKMVAE